MFPKGFEATYRNITENKRKLIGMEARSKGKQEKENKLKSAVRIGIQKCILHSSKQQADLGCIFDSEYPGTKQQGYVNNYEIQCPCDKK